MSHLPLANADQACDARHVNGAPHILVGVDHSEESFRALDFAVEEATLRKVALEVLWAPSEHLRSADGADLQVRAQTQLGEAVTARVPADLDVTVRAVIDKPESALVDSARSAELLVVGARGHGGFLGLGLGSVSLKVAAGAPCPVAVVHPKIEEPGTDTEPRIVVGTDGSGSARVALRWALAEASTRELPVVVVNGWMEPAISMNQPGIIPPMEAIEDAAKELLDTEITFAAQSAPGVTVRAQPVATGGAAALVDSSRGASLVVVGSKGQGNLVGFLLGSVTQQVLTHAGCPAIVLPSS